jgi:hypothetical protein
MGYHPPMAHERRRKPAAQALLPWLAAGALVSGAEAPARAHHAISAVYDGGSRVELEGVVRAFRLVNPHPWVEMAVTDSSGQARTWKLELDNLWELTAIGVNADTLQPGDRLVVSGSPARDRSTSLYVRQLDRPADGFRYEQVGSSPRIRGGNRRPR